MSTKIKCGSLGGHFYNHKMQNKIRLYFVIFFFSEWIDSYSWFIRIYFTFPSEGNIRNEKKNIKGRER